MDRPIPVDGYLVERKKLTGFTWLRCHESFIPETEFTVSSPPEEADYQFRVSAANKYGQSESLEFPGALHLGEFQERPSVCCVNLLIQNTCSPHATSRMYAGCS